MSRNMKLVTFSGYLLAWLMSMIIAIHGAWQVKILTLERDQLGNRVLDLEAMLPCAPTVEFHCDLFYQDGNYPRFRWAIDGVDMGVLQCFDKRGVEVTP